MEPRQPVRLQVFVKHGCETCERARSIAHQVDVDFPNLLVEVVELNGRLPARDDVFAVPTFVLEDRVLSLGNPQESELHSEIAALLQARGVV